MNTLSKCTKLTSFVAAAATIITTMPVGYISSSLVIVFFDKEAAVADKFNKWPSFVTVTFML